MYYKRYELQWRLTLFFSASIIAGAFGGALVLGVALVCFLLWRKRSGALVAPAMAPVVDEEKGSLTSSAGAPLPYLPYLPFHFREMLTGRHDFQLPSPRSPTRTCKRLRL